jgi:hypothetical protein
VEYDIGMKVLVFGETLISVTIPSHKGRKRRMKLLSLVDALHSNI